MTRKHAFRKPEGNVYTVVGLYGDDVQGDCSSVRDATFITPITAETPTIAARKAQALVKEDGESDDTIEILAVFEGALTDHYEPSADPGHA